jgi:hypothetical protein
LTLLGRYLNHRGILIRLIETLHRYNPRNFAFNVHRKADRLETLKLNLQETIDEVVLLNRWNFDGYLDLSPLFFFDFEANLLEIFVPIVASDRKDVLVMLVKFWVSTVRNHSQHQSLIFVLLGELVVECY